MENIVRNCLRVVFPTLALPVAANAGFGRWSATFSFLARVCVLVPGIVGDYIRIAFYKLTLKQCSLYSRVSFGPLSCSS